ncbi:MAG: response regulator receiver protein [Clostridia bacterium]|jgi:two-component system chemotaxis response regulator CheY|uniref:response regulator n=1 Tax=Petroclostridium xylanilyticum TaxID=1792311 RepID=UPI000B98DB26|nr:response regulator [Petroclostridium xylanilyticum]MBZ4645834.1 response regulator receiver protein [Clostridia bacterium]
MAKILIVDDSDMIKKIVVGTLARGGHQVVEASNGLEALERISSTHCDLVITDLNMPKMDGIQFTRELRKMPSYKRMPIFILTTNPAEEEKALAAGANLYLKKPVSSEKLLSSIDKYLK